MPAEQFATDNEILDVVDAQDRVIGPATRAEIHARKLLHRAVHVVVVNSRGEILLQRRSASKDTYAGFWDISVGGHVDRGEDYDAAVARELREEMGIVAPAREVAVSRASEATGWEFQHIYHCEHDGPLVPAPGEVSDVRWIALAAVLDEWTAPSPITPSAIESIRLWAVATGRLPPR